MEKIWVLCRYPRSKSMLKGPKNCWHFKRGWHRTQVELCGHSQCVHVTSQDYISNHVHIHIFIYIYVHIFIHSIYIYPEWREKYLWKETCGLLFSKPSFPSTVVDSISSFWKHPSSACLVAFKPTSNQVDLGGWCFSAPNPAWNLKMVGGYDYFLSTPPKKNRFRKKKRKTSWKSSHFHTFSRNPVFTFPETNSNFAHQKWCFPGTESPNFQGTPIFRGFLVGFREGNMLLMEEIPLTHHLGKPL